MPKGMLPLMAGNLIGNNRYINPDFFAKFKNRITQLKESNTMTLNSMLHQYMVRSRLKTLLRYEDRNSMRFSIEARTPFADDINLIEYAFKISSAFKINNGWSKSLLRSSMRGILPETIRNRRDKIGFATPEDEWLIDIKDYLKEYFTKSLNEFINIDNVLNNWNKIFKRESRVRIMPFWRFINFAVWMKVYDL